MPFEDLNTRFREEAARFIGKEVGIWTVRFDRPYVGGTLLRFADAGPVISGHGVVVYDQIDRLGCDGIEIRWATQ